MAWCLFLCVALQAEIERRRQRLLEEEQREEDERRRRKEGEDSVSLASWRIEAGRRVASSSILSTHLPHSLFMSRPNAELLEQARTRAAEAQRLREQEEERRGTVAGMFGLLTGSSGAASLWGAFMPQPGAWTRRAPRGVVEDKGKACVLTCPLCI
jgi:hypothetical protein